MPTKPLIFFSKTLTICFLFLVSQTKIHARGQIFSTQLQKSDSITKFLGDGDIGDSNAPRPNGQADHSDKSNGGSIICGVFTLPLPKKVHPADDRFVYFANDIIAQIKKLDQRGKSKRNIRKAISAAKHIGEMI